MRPARSWPTIPTRTFSAARRRIRHACRPHFGPIHSPALSYQHNPCACCVYNAPPNKRTRRCMIRLAEELPSAKQRYLDKLCNDPATACVQWLMQPIRRRRFCEQMQYHRTEPYPCELSKPLAGRAARYAHVHTTSNAMANSGRGQWGWGVENPRLDSRTGLDRPAVTLLGCPAEWYDEKDSCARFALVSLAPGCPDSVPL